MRGKHRILIIVVGICAIMLTVPFMASAQSHRSGYRHWPYQPPPSTTTPGTTTPGTTTPGTTTPGTTTPGTTTPGTTTVTVPYLLLVSFYNGIINQSNLASGKSTIAPQMNASAYQGIAVMPIPWNVPYGGWSDMAWIESTGIGRVWPWVFTNRIVGCPSGTSCPSGFQNIVGVDVQNKAGALQNFYDLWTAALVEAKNMGTPGIVLDVEPYNDSNTYNMSYVQQKTGMTSTQLDTTLRDIGHHLTDIVNQVYPNAVILSLSATLMWQDNTWSRLQIGILEQAKSTSSKMQFVELGEDSLGYCFSDLNDLNSKISYRQNQYAPFLSQYPHLKLGGTIAPWHNVALKTGWMTQGACGAAQMKTVSDFQPFFTKLLSVYDYVFIYAASAAGYDPFNSAIEPLYDTVLRASWAAASKARGN